MWFSSAVMEWWDEWQLRILVLCSLCAQYFLAIFGAVRKSAIPGWWRCVIWLSYFASDLLATFALTALFSRQVKLECNPVHGNISIEVLWAPILLMHLGGQRIITAYNIEDNELWMRSLATAVYKPLALKRASFSRILSTLEPGSRSTTTVDSEQELEDFVREARTFVQGIPIRVSPPSPTTLANSRSNNARGHDLLNNTDNLFLDIPYPYSDRLAVLKAFWLLGDARAYQLLNNNLSKSFDRLFTKFVTESDGNNNVLGSCCSRWTVGVAVVLPTQALVLLVMVLVSGNIKFHDEKKGYKTSDIIVTIVLLSLTFVLESQTPTKYVPGGWNAMVSQHSIIDFFARSQRHAQLMSIAEHLQCKDLVGSWFLCMEPCYSALEITILVRRHLQTECWPSARSGILYKMINDSSGELTLGTCECDQLKPSLEKPFDQSILIWHLATDFCFHLTITSSCTQRQRTYANCCRKISNYMMHLLFSNPEMLMSGSRKSLLKITDEELEDIFKNVETRPVDREGSMQVIMDQVQSSGQGFFHDAWLLAHDGLMGLNDNEKMWEVMLGVWIEMLCFSAGRSRGYLHAKSLGSGGEFLSYIWLLLAYAGMETLSDKLQRRQHYRLFWRQMLEENDSGPSTPQGTDNAAAAGSSASKGKDPVKEEEEDATPSTSHGTDLVKKQENNDGCTEIEVVVLSS